jgi:hypothetical protein
VSTILFFAYRWWQRNYSFGDDFIPSVHPEQIAAVNAREPRPLQCQPQAGTGTWPTTASPDPVAAFALQVRDHGASDAGCGMLELNRLTVDLALQIAVSQNVIRLDDVWPIRRRADVTLFKPNSRSFVLMHGYSKSLTIAGEPTLLAERLSEGRLVGMSMGAARGFPPAGIGLLIFEDRVCFNDLSFTIHFPSLSGDGGWRDPDCDEFLFGGEASILPILAAAYSPFVPTAPRHSASSIPGLAPADLIAGASLAIDIVKLLIKL